MAAQRDLERVVNYTECLVNFDGDLKPLVPNSPLKGYTEIGTGGSRKKTAKLSKQMERERLDLTELSCLCSVIRSSHYVQSENGH